MTDFERLGERVATGLGGVADDRYEQVRSHFLRRAQAATAGRRRRTWAWLALVGLVASALAGMGWWLQSSLAVEVEAPSPLAAEDLWLEGPKHGAPTRVELGNGAHLDLLAGTRSRVHRTSDGLTRVTLEGGMIEVSVSEGDGESWSFYAGPYLIKTTGGGFFLNYQPGSPRLEAGVAVGALRISGGSLGPDSVVLEAGQELKVGDGSIAVSALPGGSQ